MTLKAKEFFVDLLFNERYTYIFIKTFILLFGKNRKDSSVNGVGETQTNFKYVKNSINEVNLSQWICDQFPNHETIDELKNVFVFDLETCNVDKFAEAMHLSCMMWIV